MADRFVDPARLDQPRIRHQERPPRAYPQRAVAQFGKRAGTEHDFRRMELGQLRRLTGRPAPWHLRAGQFPGDVAFGPVVGPRPAVVRVLTVDWMWHAASRK